MAAGTAMGPVRRAAARPARLDPSHPLGCHKPRIADRIIFEKLIQVLRFGCSYASIADCTCGATTIRDRRNEWIKDGIFADLKTIARESYDRIVGLALRDIAVDGCITKAPGGGECAAPSGIRSFQLDRTALVLSSRRLPGGGADVGPLPAGWPPTAASRRGSLARTGPAARASLMRASASSRIRRSRSRNPAWDSTRRAGEGQEPGSGQGSRARAWRRSLPRTGYRPGKATPGTQLAQPSRS